MRSFDGSSAVRASHGSAFAAALAVASPFALTSLARSGPASASLAARSRAGVQVKVLLDALTYARDTGDWEAVQRDAGQLLGWIEEGSRGVGAT